MGFRSRRNRRPGWLESALLAAMLRAVSAGSEDARGEARVGMAVIRAEVDRSRVVPYEPPGPETRHRRREDARAVAQALYAAAPEDVAEMGIAYLDTRTGVGKFISDVLDNLLPSSRDKAREKGVAGHWRGSWLPLELMAEHFAPYIGPDNPRFLREPVPPRAVRVLIITGNSSDVIDVDLEVAQAARVKAELDEVHAAEAILPRLEADLNAARKSAKAVRLPPFEGTWRDGRAYLPAEIPAAWTVREVDDRGVVTVAAEDGVTFQLGASRRDGRRLVTVMILGKDASKPTRASVEPILSRLRGARKFVEMAAFRDEEVMPMPGMRIFSGRLAGDGVS